MQQEIRDRIRNIERGVTDIKKERGQALSTNRTALRSHINRIRETFRRIFHEVTKLAERIRTLFQEQGFTLASILTAFGIATSSLVLALTGMSVPAPGTGLQTIRQVWFERVAKKTPTGPWARLG